MKEIVIDANNTALGRLASFAAKQALQGNSITIVNAEKAIIIGKPKKILERYLEKSRLGHGAQKGPIFSIKSDAIVRRAIRGMLGRKKARGREAFKKIRCYESMPEKYAGAEKLTFKKDALNFITIESLVKSIRQK